jgi:hypothetical protein
MITALPVALLSFSEIASFLGVPRSNRLCLAPELRPSTASWLLLLPNSSSFACSFVSSEFLLSLAPRMWCHNLSTLTLASNSVYHARTKHIEVDYYFVLEKVLNKDISISFISTADQLASVFTKGLSNARFHLLQSKLIVLPILVTLRGMLNLIIQLP